MVHRLGRGGPASGAIRRLAPVVALLAGTATFAPPPAPAAQPDTRGPALSDGVAGLARGLEGKDRLAAAERTALHARKAALVDAAFGDAVLGVTYGQVLTALDCVGRDLQRARNAGRRAAARRWTAEAQACRDRLAKALSAGGQAPPAVRRDVASLGTRLRAVARAVRRGRAFGSEATALRRAASELVQRHFAGKVLGDLPFPSAFRDLECVDVKVEAGRLAGAAACAKRLARALAGSPTTNAPNAGPAITFGSDLAGEPVALPGTYLDDTEFWTSALTVPVDGTITRFRLKVGAGPVALPLRFSVVRPAPGGRVEVQTTTHPVYPLPRGAPGTYTFDTSVLSFPCCRARAGDIVTVDNSGTTTRDPYVWFARSPGSTTFSNTMGGDSQNKGVLWTGIPHAGYEVLLQVVLQPS